MRDKIERIYEYRALRGRHDDGRVPLSEQELARMERLRQQLPTSIPSVDERDPYTLLSTPLAVHFESNGQVGFGTLRNASGDGLAIATAEPPQLGAFIVVHAREQEQGLEYTFPGRVMARIVKGVTAVGIAFDGTPSQHRASSRASGVWRPEAVTSVAPALPRNKASGSQ